MVKRIFLLIGVFIALIGSSAFRSSLSPATTDSIIQWYSAELKKVRDGDTIEVQFANEKSITHPIRLAGVSAPEYSDKPDKPEPCQVIAKDAKEWFDKYLNAPLMIGLGPTGDSEHIRFHTTQDRLLGYVSIRHTYTSTSQQPTQIELVSYGLARLDVHADEFFGTLSGLNEFSFSMLYAERLIKEQIHAAKTRTGWWGLCDLFETANLAIAAINFWDEPQIVYIINRGEKDLKLADYALRDRGNNQFRFSSNCELAAGQELEIHIGNKLNSEEGPECGKEKDGKLVITWQIENEEKVWNLSATTSKGRREVACLMKVENINDEKACTEDSRPGVPGLCYVYQYPPDDGEQTPSSEMQIDSGCSPSRTQAITENLE